MSKLNKLTRQVAKSRGEKNRSGTKFTEDQPVGNERIPGRPRWLRGPTGATALIFDPIERLIMERMTNHGVIWGQRFAASVARGLQGLRHG